MLTGNIRNQIDQIWNTFWSGGVSNPLSVIEQITYLLFIKRLDDLQTLEENKAEALGIDVERRIFPEGEDDRGRPYADLRWSRFRNFEAREMMQVLEEHVFPFLRDLAEQGSAYGRHLRDARLGVANPATLSKVVEMLDQVPMDDRDTKGDVYEYMLGKIASAGQNGQFRTPRHIIQLMVELSEPTPEDVICDPAAGSCGFLVAAGEYLRDRHPEVLRDEKRRKHFHEDMFHGFDFDPTMLRIGAMNMILHGVEDADVSYRDSLAEEHDEDAGTYSLILANPPFAGSLDYDRTAKDLQRIVKTKKTELLFVGLFQRLLKNSGRAVVIVPNGVLESDSSAHVSIRKTLIDNNNLEGVISLPHWIFRPYASVATSILIFRKLGPTQRTWFYKLENDGFSSDAQKTPVDGSEIPEIKRLWQNRENADYAEDPKKHRWVDADEIRENGYDLCPSVYLSGYKYPDRYPLERLSDYFTVTKGGVGAAKANNGAYPFVTSAMDIKSYDSWSFDGEAICIPTVSATGHGHAAIKTIHYVNDKFEAASITAVLRPKSEKIYVPYVYYYLRAHKDELLVPLMRGAANVSLNLDRLMKLRIPVPQSIDKQRALVRDIEEKEESIRERKKELSKARSQFGCEMLNFRETF